MVHVRFEGRSVSYSRRELGVGPTSDDAHVLARVAQQLGVPRNRLLGYVVDRGTKGALIVRPEAVYG